MASVQESLRSGALRSEHKLRRVGLWVVGITGTLALLWVGYRLWNGEESRPGYVTSPVERRDIASYVTATGNLSPVVEVQVGSLVSGRIKQLYADYNSEVKAGQVIATIDPQLFESAVSQAQAQLTSAEADLARSEAVEVNAKLEYERLAKLDEAGVVASAEVDQARADWLAAQAQIKAARAGIRQARATLKQSQTNLTYTTIRSPIDGIVVSRNVDVGQVVAASLQAPTLFVIAEDLRNMEVHTSVAESDVGQLTPGMRADFFVDAFPGETFRGVVKQLRYEAVTLSNVVTYDAVIQVQNNDLKLRPGMTANVNFVIAEAQRALVIPNRALRFQPSDPALRRDEAAERPEQGMAVGKPSENHRRAGEPDAAAASTITAARTDKTRAERGRRRRIWRLYEGIPEPIFVTLGISDGTDIEVVEGPLQEGDLVIVAESSGEPVAERRRGPPRVF
jgi:HlyD family secretion protein